MKNGLCQHRFLVPAPSAPSSVGHQVLVIVNQVTYYVIEDYVNCMVGNKSWPGVDTGPCLNARLGGVLKEINAQTFIPRNMVVQ